MAEIGGFEGNVPIPQLVRWDELVANLDWTGLHRDTEWGFHRGRAPSVHLRNARATFVFLPFGQASPPHHKNGDCVIIQLQGTTEFTLAGEDHRLAPHDCLVIPADEVYSYRNCGLEDSIFVGLIALASTWPPTNTYVDESS